jgi:hypothetical protein
VPVAVNCWVTPAGRLGLAGVTNMEERVAEFTVRVVFPDEPELVALLGVLEAAVMVTVPMAMAVARPLLLTVTTEVSDELQVTCVVISWVV